jgi:hypothetical protein
MALASGTKLGPYEILSALGAGGMGDQEHDVSVQNWSEVMSISPDGRLLLNGEGAGSGPDYDVFVRASDGAAPVRVGDGIGYDFSPDMKWVLSSLTLRIPRQLFLIPLGIGETKQITHDLIDRGRARFLPDGKNVVFTGTEPGHYRAFSLNRMAVGGGSAIRK